MSPQRLAETALIFVALVWGVTFVMVQDAVAELPVLAFLAYRFLPAALLVGVIFRRALRELDADGWRIGALMGFFLTSGYILQTFALQHTTASNVGFITGLVVVLTPVLGAVAFGMPVPRAAFACAGLAAVGLALLSGVGGETRFLGDGLALGCALCFSLHIFATNRGVAGHEVGALLAVQLGVCGLTCLAAAAVAGQLETPRGATVWSALLVTSLLASALAFFIQSYAQRHAPPARTALILASEPAFAGLAGWLLAGDRLTALGWVGAVLILVAIAAAPSPGATSPPPA